MEPSPPTDLTGPPRHSSISPEQPGLIKNAWQQTLQNRTAVVGTLFLVTGALGLPLLWYSPVFTRLEKWLWSALTMLYTSALIGVTWAIVYWCYRFITGSF